MSSVVLVDQYETAYIPHFADRLLNSVPLPRIPLKDTSPISLLYRFRLTSFGNRGASPLVLIIAAK